MSQTGRKQILFGSVIVVVVALLLIWRLTMSHDPTIPTATFPAGPTPVFRGSGEAVASHSIQLPPLPVKK